MPTLKRKKRIQHLTQAGRAIEVMFKNTFAWVDVDDSLKRLESEGFDKRELRTAFKKQFPEEAKCLH